MDNYTKKKLHNLDNKYAKEFIKDTQEIRSRQEQTLGDLLKLNALLKDKPELSRAIEGYNWDSSYDWKKGVPQYGNPKDMDANNQMTPEIANLVNQLKGRVDLEQYLPHLKNTIPKTIDDDSYFKDRDISSDNIDYAKDLINKREMVDKYKIPPTLSPLNTLGYDESFQNEEDKKKEIKNRFNKLFQK